MKVKVTKGFRDKFTKENYKPGAIVELTDGERIADLVSRGLAELVKEEEPEEKPKKKTRKKK